MIWNNVAERANGTNIIKAEKIGSAVIFLRMIAEIIRLMFITVKNMRKENDGTVKHIGKNCMTEIYDLRIRCNNPDCGLEKHHKIELDDESFDIVLKEIEFAVNDWNRRAGEQNE